MKRSDIPPTADECLRELAQVLATAYLRLIGDPRADVAPPACPGPKDSPQRASTGALGQAETSGSKAPLTP